MWLDERNEFADAAALSTGGTGRGLVGDQINLGSTSGPNVGDGEPVYWVVQVDTAVTSTGSATVDFELVSDDSASINTTGTATVHASTGAIAVASLVAGYQRAVALPLATNYEQYLGVIANVATAALSTGKINSFLTRDVSMYRSYPDAL